MKKANVWIISMLMLLFMLALPSIGHAAQQTHINLNGKEISLPADGQVTTVKGSIMVPLRVVVEQLGYKVSWSNATQTATIKQGSNTLQLTADSYSASVNNNPVDLEAAPSVHNGTTLVPLRFISENTGTTVKWDNAVKTVYLTTASAAPAPTTAASTGKDTAAPQQEDLAQVNAISFSDNRLTITVDGNVSPKYSALNNPDRIVLDLPKTSFSSTFLHGQKPSVGAVNKVDVTGYPDVAGIRYSLFSSSPSTVRIVLDLNNAQQYKVINNQKGVVMVELDGALNPAPPAAGTETTPAGTTTGSASADNEPSQSVPATPSSGPGKNGKMLVVIDAGHGGKDPGAPSIQQRREKDFTLAVVLKIQALLQQEPNIDFVLTRSDDTYPTLQGRVKTANDLNADLFVSIHGNSTSSAVSPSGTEIYYTRSDSKQFAKVIHDHVVSALGLPDRGIHTKSLHVTRETKMPAVLIEAGYLSSMVDEPLMYTDDFQQKLAQAVVDGMKEYLGVE
ncbi:N-acetylmuramoyl-L-alanine amidase family protein [Paenibacillus wulumuqiensis]|uniref:N-acetylmuramoyl-L-alanine amidase family protein n=1 Tax=Paenibacillus wulumuqiensis TaxID=1567107 RepID=UPI0006196893|nr:N-acetylmuramoyl-L-alanine amidase family protein [Paenibacillus wulumuqiensis]